MKPLVYHIICGPHWVKTVPLAGEYLCKFAESRGIKVKLIDLNSILYTTLGNPHQWLRLDEEFEQTLFEHTIRGPQKEVLHDFFTGLAQADVIAFSLYRRNQIFTLSFIEELIYAYPQKKIVIGGPHTRWMELQKKQFDPRFSWVIGEGEKPLLKVIESSGPVTVRFDELDDLDEIPFLDFSQYDLSLYSPVLPLFSSRGCIRNCVFCTERLLTRTFRQHSPGYMADQIELLHKKYNTRVFSFQDSLINADIGWLESFCRRLSDKKIDIIWEAQGIVRNDFDVSLGKLLKESGCYNLFIGLESAADDTLGRMNKGFTQRDAHAFFSKLHKARLNYEISLIVGFPGETESQFLETYEFIRNHKELIPKIAQVNPYVDYFRDDLVPSDTGGDRVRKLIEMFKTEKIRYTKSFINNLVYL
ncbi:MAG: radical SAM protein [Candidatus Omnitrophica bacterium]|nr:radical SAM protein [Candidatus Omnitrophota bacterium]